MVPSGFSLSVFAPSLPEPAGVRYNSWVLRAWKVVWLGVSLLAVSGCVEERGFPEPAQMCRDLVEACGEPMLWEYSDLQTCYEIGRAGVKESTREDQCFAIHSECVNDCLYLSAYLERRDAADAESPDGSMESTLGEPADASATNIGDAPFDASAPDAASDGAVSDGAANDLPER